MEQASENELGKKNGASLCSAQTDRQLVFQPSYKVCLTLIKEKLNSVDIKICWLCIVSLM